MFVHVRKTQLEALVDAGGRSFLCSAPGRMGYLGVKHLLFRFQPNFGVRALNPQEQASPALLGNAEARNTSLPAQPGIRRLPREGNSDYSVMSQHKYHYRGRGSCRQRRGCDPGLMERRSPAGVPPGAASSPN